MLAPNSPPPSVRRAIAKTVRDDAVLRCARGLWPALVTLALAGMLGAIFPQARLPLPNAVVSIAAGLVLITAAWLTFEAYTSFRPMTQQQAIAEIEAAAGLSELGPLSAADDRSIGGDPKLWAYHQYRLAQAAGLLSKPIKPKLTRLDAAKAFALLLGMAICLWQPTSATRFLTFDLSPLMGDGSLTVDAWADPPEYTGLPSIRLDRMSTSLKLPVGSIIHARLDGANGAPVLRGPATTAKLRRERGQAWSGQIELKSSGEVILKRLGTRASWHITAIQDAAPKLVSADPITVDNKGRLALTFSATDDYGIKEAVLSIEPQKPLPGLAGHSRFEVPIPLEGPLGEDGARRVFLNVADHPLTGLAVRLRLIVRDALGQEVKGEINQLVMPERQWKSAFAAALQEQRLLILREARPFGAVRRMVATLFETSFWQDRGFDSQASVPIILDLSDPSSAAAPGIARARTLLSATLNSMRTTGLSDDGILGLHYALERLTLARTVDQAHDVAPILWEMAVLAETSDQTPAQQKLAEARQALEQALRNGASEDEIKQLTQEMREAVGERLNELAQQGQQSGEGESGSGGQQVTGGDLDDMLKQLEQSGTSGAREEALSQLDQLDQLMENLTPGGTGSGTETGGQAGGSGPLDDAMRQQRALLDETEKRGQQENPGPATDLAEQQKALAESLGKVEEPRAGGKDGNGPQTDPNGQEQMSKQQALQAMQQAVEALRRGDMNGARDAQAQAEQALRDAASAGASASGNGAGNLDPLGRKLPQRDDGSATKIPKETERRRARDVRDELRRRQGDASRDAEERNYLDRLLKDK